MMFRWLIATLVLASCGACQEPMKRLNAPPHGETENVSDLRGTFDHMVDNAMLADMTITDIHFRPHRAQLNTLGQERLRRLAALLDEYGGTIRYNTDETDEALVAERGDVLVDGLEELGIEVTAETVRRDLPGGRGLSAAEAILIRATKGTFTPSCNSSGASGAGAETTNTSNSK